MTNPQQPPNTLRPIHRFITTHSTTGAAILATTIPPAAPRRSVNNAMTFSLLYTNPSFPAPLSTSSDISTYENYLINPPAITIPNGSVCRVCDFPPNYTTPMHRTHSLDYGVVLEGEMELVLDSGETQRLGRGDTVVQRGTMHAWRNVGVGWARMFYVLEDAEGIVVGGRELRVDEGGID